MISAGMKSFSHKKAQKAQSDLPRQIRLEAALVRRARMGAQVRHLNWFSILLECQPSCAEQASVVAAFGL